MRAWARRASDRIVRHFVLGAHRVPTPRGRGGPVDRVGEVAGLRSSELDAPRKLVHDSIAEYPPRFEVVVSATSERRIGCRRRTSAREGNFMVNLKASR